VIGILFLLIVAVTRRIKLTIIYNKNYSSGPNPKISAPPRRNVVEMSVRKCYPQCFHFTTKGRSFFDHFPHTAPILQSGDTGASSMCFLSKFQRHSNRKPRKNEFENNSFIEKWK
jgi:hypothetical protein